MHHLDLLDLEPGIRADGVDDDAAQLQPFGYSLAGLATPFAKLGDWQIKLPVKGRRGGASEVITRKSTTQPPPCQNMSEVRGPF